MSARGILSGKRGILGPILFVGVVGVLTLFNLHQFSGWIAGTDGILPPFPSQQNRSQAPKDWEYSKLLFLRQIKAHFSGWELVADDNAAGVVGLPGQLPFIGPAKARTVKYEAALSDQEYAELASRVVARMERTGSPVVGLVAPEASAGTRVVVLLRMKSKGIVLFVPLDLAPKRIAEALDGQ